MARRPQPVGVVIHREFFDSQEFYGGPGNDSGKYWAAWLAVCLLGTSDPWAGWEASPERIRHRHLMRYSARDIPSIARVTGLIQHWLHTGLLAGYTRNGVKYLNFTRRLEFLSPKLSGSRDEMNRDDGEGEGDSPPKNTGPRPGQTFQQWRMETDAADAEATRSQSVERGMKEA